MAGTKFGHADRQVTIGLQALVEDLHVAGTIHRLDGERLLLVGDLRHKHVFAVLCPVARTLPQGAIQQHRGLHLDIVVLLDLAADVGLQRAPERMTLGMPEDLTGGFLLNVEEVHLAADLAMVALLRFLDAMEVVVELLLVAPGGAINALQLRVLRVTTPVSARNLGQLERCADLRRRHEMRAAAEVVPVAVIVDPDLLIRRQILDDLRLVLFTEPQEVGHSFVAVPNSAPRRQVLLDKLSHLGLDARQVFGREWLVAGEIIEESVLDVRADRDLRAREQGLDRLGQKMRGVMTNEVECVDAFAGDNLDLCIG